MKGTEAGILGMRDAMDERMNEWRKQNVSTDKSLTLSVFHSAIYLCKRTMQNKTRLELADYEAVSAGPIAFLDIDLCVKLGAEKHNLLKVRLV